jgi:uncharacterized protein
MGAEVVATEGLTTAVKARDLAGVLALLEAGADPDERSSYGAPLHVAAGSGSLEIAIALLNAGADSDLRGFGGMSPLHAAALAGQAAIADILIERGANVDALDNFGRTPLLSFASGSTQNLDTLRILLEAGANPNLEEGTTKRFALAYAAIRGRADMAELLVVAGAAVNAKDSLTGQTPLHYATDCCNAVQSNPDLVRFLIDHGADVNAKNMNGNTPFDYVLRCAPNNGLLRGIFDKAGAR